MLLKPKFNYGMPFFKSWPNILCLGPIDDITYSLYFIIGTMCICKIVAVNLCYFALFIYEYLLLPPLFLIVTSNHHQVLVLLWMRKEKSNHK